MGRWQDAQPELAPGHRCEGGATLTPGSAALASCHKQLDMVHFSTTTPWHPGNPLPSAFLKGSPAPRKAAANSHPDRSGGQERTGDSCLNPKARGVFPAGSGWQRGTAQGQPGCLQHREQRGRSLTAAPGLAHGARSNMLLANSPNITRDRAQAPGAWSSTWRCCVRPARY